MAIVIARNGVIVTAKGYGEIDGRPATIDTPMLLHSAMKPLIGLQLATYVDRGILGLDEPIGNFLPDFNTPQIANTISGDRSMHTPTRSPGPAPRRINSPAMMPALRSSSA